MAHINEKPKHIGRQRGQAMITSVLFFLFISLSIVFGIANPILRESGIVRAASNSKDSFFAAESLAEDVTYRLKKGLQTATEETLTLNGGVASTTIVDTIGGKEITASGDVSGAVRRVKTSVVEGSGATFNFGVQSGEGGFVMENNSSINGSAFSNGPISGTGSSIVRGDVISAGPSGFVDGVHATGTVRANTIENSNIEGDAYYQSISNTTVLGTSFPGSSDQATSSLPISDSQVDDWKAGAEAGGTISSPCPYEIEDDVTIGPIKISCDVKVSGSPTVTLAGNVWVVGNIEIENSSIIKIASSLGSSDVVVIADDPADRLSGSKIILKNNIEFQNSGTEGSYILFLSQNNSAENEGSEKAISVENSAEGELLVYAGHGEIELKNNIGLKEVTGYRIRLSNSASITYESGLANLLFTAGPGGGFSIEGWGEVE